jgi:hypothetical protein
MGMRSGPKDFGYTFVKTEEEEDHDVVLGGGDDDVETGVGSDNADAKASRQQQAPHTEAETPYRYTPLKRDRYGSGGKNNGALSAPSGQGYDDRNGGDALPCVLLSAGVCCCCTMAILLIAGAILLVCAHYDADSSSGSNSSLALAGWILLILGGASFLLGVCSCCFTCVAATCASSDGVLGATSGHYEDAHMEVKVRFRRLNDRYEKAEDAIDSIHLDVIVGMKETREAQKKQAQKRKEEEKKKKEELERQLKRDLEAGLTIQTIRRNYRPIAFLIYFDGDTMVTGMELLRKQVSIIVNCGRAGVDRAIVVVTSPGGAVASYGLAASQLVRIRKAGIKLVVCVDTIAASGGYMMASVGDQIYAAPFALIGSIGVVTHVPNLSRFLDKHDIDAFLFTGKPSLVLCLCRNVWLACVRTCAFGTGIHTNSVHSLCLQPANTSERST